MPGGTKHRGKKKDGKQSRSAKLEELQSAVAELSDGNGEDTDFADFASVLAEVKREIFEYKNQSADGRLEGDEVPSEATGQPKRSKKKKATESAAPTSAEPLAGFDEAVPPADASPGKQGMKSESSNYMEVRREELRRRISERIREAREGAPKSQSVHMKDCSLEPNRHVAQQMANGLEDITRNLFDLGVLRNPEQVRAFKAQIFDFTKRAGYGPIEALQVVVPLFYAHGTNLWAHRRAVIAAKVLHEKMGNLAQRWLADRTRYKPWPVRRFADVCSVGEQAPHQSEDLKQLAQDLLKRQHDGEISSSRAQVEWEVAKFDARVHNGLVEFLNVACGALVCKNMREITVCLMGFEKVLKSEGMTLVQLRNGFDEQSGPDDLPNEFQGVPHMKLFLKLNAPKDTCWDGYICEVQIHHQMMYEVMQLTMTGTLGVRLRRDILYDPVLERAKDWQSSPTDPDDHTVGTYSPAPGMSSVAIIQDRMMTMAADSSGTSHIDTLLPNVIDMYSADDKCELKKHLPPKLSRCERVQALYLLGHLETAPARAAEWEACLIDIADDSDVWSEVGNLHSTEEFWDTFCLEALTSACDGDGIHKAMEAGRLMQLLHPVDRVKGMSAFVVPFAQKLGYKLEHAIGAQATGQQDGISLPAIAAPSEDESAFGFACCRRRR